MSKKKPFFSIGSIGNRDATEETYQYQIILGKYSGEKKFKRKINSQIREKVNWGVDGANFIRA